MQQRFFDHLPLASRSCVGPLKAAFWLIARSIEWHSTLLHTSIKTLSIEWESMMKGESDA